MSDAATDTLEANLRVLRSRWPALAGRIAAAPFPKEISVTETPEPTLVVDGIHLTSGYDPASEARTQAELVPPESAEAWIYGVGLGELPRALLTRSALRRLHVVFLNAGVLRTVIELSDQSDWLGDDRVDLVDGAAETRLRKPFAAVPSCLRLASDAAARLRDLVAVDLATGYIKSQFVVDDAWLARLEADRPFVERDGDVTSLFGSRAGGDLSVAAAGPTLADGYDLLRARRGSGPLIAVDAALTPLLAAGIAPEVVISIDAGESVLRFFEVDLAQLSNSCLVYFPGVAPDVLRAWPFRRVAAYPARSLRYRSLSRRLPRGELWSSGSVVHPAIDLAVRMGAARVTLFGADFAYPGGMSHVAGATVARPVDTSLPSTPWVLDGSGQRVPTMASFRWFLRDLEGYIQRHPEVRFVAASRRGARIEGTRYLDESEGGAT